MEIVCRKCAYKWDYKGKATRISCSKCKTSITIQRRLQEHSLLQSKEDLIVTPPSDLFVHKVPTPQETKSVSVVDRVHFELPTFDVCLPLNLLDSVAFSRAKVWSKTNGEDHIKLKSNGEGVLSLA